MKTSTVNENLTAMAFVLAAALLTGCGPKSATPTNSMAAKSIPPASAAWPDPLVLVLVPQVGDMKTDVEIRKFQDQVRQGSNRDLALEQLGWLFVAKARESFDAGYYKLAEQCALAMEQNDPQSNAALLLRGHVLDSLHRFHEAEILARQLVERRGEGFDYGLLGDALMEQGRLNEAVAAYQRMMNLRPDLHAYARAAHVRWLTGDLDGAIEAMSLAVSAATPHDPESTAWVSTRLANYEFQAGRPDRASRLCRAALSFQTNYPPALLLRGKMLLADGKPAEAVKSLRAAAQFNPLPEYEWVLADALRAAGCESEAATVEAQLRRGGAASDPRTLALFLATRRQSPELALRLAREELASRGDVFTHDALAWALWADAQDAAAQAEMQLALAAGTQDARLFFHAAVIASQSGRAIDALNWTKKSEAVAQMLLPSERKELQELSSRLALPGTAAARRPETQISAF
jgi:tetratricopeptide (TPR) repeat protein